MRGWGWGGEGGGGKGGEWGWREGSVCLCAPARYTLHSLAPLLVPRQYVWCAVPTLKGYVKGNPSFLIQLRHKKITTIQLSASVVTRTMTCKANQLCQMRLCSITMALNPFRWWPCKPAVTVDEAGMEVTGVLVFLFSQGDFLRGPVHKKLVGPWVQDQRC